MSDAAISFPFLGYKFSINPSRSFSLFGLNIYWYGVIIAVGFVLALLYITRRRKVFGLTEDNVFDMILVVIPSSIICARLYYVIFNLDAYRGNFADVFKIWEGGLAIYGGIIGGVIGLAIYCRAKKVSIGAMLDIASLGVLIGQCIGRWGNFINREAYGTSEKVNSFVFRMGLTPEGGSTVFVHPTFLYESLWNLIGFIILHFYSKKRKFDGEVCALYIIWYGLGRFFIEQLRTDSLYLFNTGIRVSQLLAAISLCAALIYLIKRRINGCDPEKLYVNAAAATADAAAEEPEEKKEETFDFVDEDEFDEDAEYEYVFEDITVEEDEAEAPSEKREDAEEKEEDEAGN